MIRPPELSEQEWTLVLELLETERRELPSEMHHTDSREMRKELEERLRLVEATLLKFRALAEVH
jgi:hypothetical protein